MDLNTDLDADLDAGHAERGDQAINELWKRAVDAGLTDVDKITEVVVLATLADLTPAEFTVVLAEHGHTGT